MVPTPGASPRSHLEFLRKDAKRLLRAARAGDADALARLRSTLPKLAALDDASAREAIRLADAQQAIAREYGHPNWAALKHHDDPLARFLVAVRGGALAVIRHHLAEFAPLATQSVHAAAALGHRAALEQHLDRDPGLLTATYRDWSPLAYVCASPLNRISPRHSAGLLECARLLLDRGAPANEPVAPPETPLFDNAPSGPMPLLVRAMMSANVPVSMLLQRHGVNPQEMMPWLLDVQRRSQVMGSVFREHFQRPDVRARMHAEAEKWKQQFGPTHPDPLALDLRTMHAPKSPGFVGMHDVWGPLMERGYDMTKRQPNGRTVLHNLARDGHADLVALLLEKGLDPNLTDADGRSVLATAIRAGQPSVAEVLRNHGAKDDDVRPIDRLLGACVRADTTEAQAIVVAHPDVMRQFEPSDYAVLVRAAADNRVDVLGLMLTLGVDPNGLDETGATALHQAAWNGHVDAVHLLLHHGASKKVTDLTYAQRPVDWATNGSTECRDSSQDYAATLALLREPSSA